MDRIPHRSAKENSKYRKYLASREWALKREAVRERSCGSCERCRVGDHDSTHHLTYEHIYDEPLDDLIGICIECHEYLSGKRKLDPIAVHHCGRGWDKTISYFFSECGSISEIEELWDLFELPCCDKKPGKREDIRTTIHNTFGPEIKNSFGPGKEPF